jgi:putative nucleotidyltransferase with HDIG domain
VFWAEGAREAAVDVASERSGTWFDPQLSAVVAGLGAGDPVWRSLESPDVRSVEPVDLLHVADEDRLDRIAAAFARVVDAKSPYTASHSAGVAAIAVGLGRTMGLGDGDLRLLHRAGLLHDIGKLAVSNLILDKPGKLTDAEWAVMKTHPTVSLQILKRVPALDSIAGTAAAHHERLDGSGYPFGIDASEMDVHARILAVADVAEALSADRPYRDSLPTEKVLDIMRRDAGAKLDGVAFTALEAFLPEWRAGASGAAASALAA